MANWKKVIVSGSAAELASLQLDTALPVAQGGIGASSLTDKAVLISQDSGTDAVGSLALTSNGSLIIGGTSGPAVEAASDLAGSGLAATTGDGTLALSIGAGTGIDVAADAISVDVSDFMTNGSNNRIVTATGTDAMNAEANLTFDGSGLSVTGHVTASGNISGSATSTGSFARIETVDSIIPGNYVFNNVDVNKATSVVLGPSAFSSADDSAQEGDNQTLVAIGSNVISAVERTKNSVYIGADVLSGYTGGSARINSAVVIGKGAGTGMANASNMTIIGADAASTTGGANSVIIGRQANAGQYGTSVGYQAGGAESNVSIGSFAGAALGHSGVYIGYQTGQNINNTNADQNTFLGNRAGRTDTAGSNLTNTSNTILIGHDTHATADGTNEIVIGTNAEGAGSNTTVIGNSSQTHVIFSGDALISGSAASTGSFGKLEGDGSSITNLPITALNNATANELVTVGATTTELDAESLLTWNGSVLGVGIASPSIVGGIHVKNPGVQNTIAVFESADPYVSLQIKDNQGGGLFEFHGANDAFNFYGSNGGKLNLTVSETKVSGSAKSTGSFGFITGSKIQGTFLGDGNALDLSSNSTIGSNIFSTVAVAGQSNIVADSNSDTLTLAESTGLGITTNAGNDTVTFALDSAQTSIQTIFNTGLILGRASGDTTIDFTADDVIVFDAGASEKMRVDTSGVDITGVLTVSSNATIQGDLVVNGSTTTLSTTNLAVGDQFIFAATGSAGSNVDAGLVVQSGSAANTGSAFYHDIDSQRWAVAKTVASNAVAVTPNQFVGTITLNSNPPSNSDGEYGVGEMWIETDTQDIFIRTG